MVNQYKEMSKSEAWAITSSAVQRALSEVGYGLKRRPGRGRANTFEAEKNGKTYRISIRTTRGRKFAFPSKNQGKVWKTLVDVDWVAVGAVNDRDNPQHIEVYLFDAAEVRKRFDAAYTARTKAGLVVRDGFGMWVSLDKDTRDLPGSVGTGLGNDFPPIAVYPIEELVLRNKNADTSRSAKGNGAIERKDPATIAEVVDRAKQEISVLAGVDTAAVTLDLRIEY
jgi:hypothetical protein